MLPVHHRSGKNSSSIEESPPVSSRPFGCSCSCAKCSGCVHKRETSEKRGEDGAKGTKPATMASSRTRYLKHGSGDSSWFSGACPPFWHRHTPRVSSPTCCHCKRNTCKLFGTARTRSSERSDAWDALGATPPLRTSTPKLADNRKKESGKGPSMKRLNFSDQPEPPEREPQSGRTRHANRKSGPNSTSIISDELERVKLTPQATYLNLADISQQKFAAVCASFLPRNEEGGETVPPLIKRYFETLLPPIEEGSEASLAPIKRGSETPLPPTEEGLENSLAPIERGSDTSLAPIEEGSETSPIERGAESPYLETPKGPQTTPSKKPAGEAESLPSGREATGPYKQPMAPASEWKSNGIFETYEQEVIFRTFGVHVEPKERIIVKPAETPERLYYQVPCAAQPTEPERSTFVDVWLEYRETHPQSFATAAVKDTPAMRRTLERMGQLINYPRAMLQHAFWRALGEWGDTQPAGQLPNSSTKFDQIYQLADGYYYDVEHQNLSCYELNGKIYTLFHGYIYYRIAMVSLRPNPSLQRRLRGMTEAELKVLAAIGGPCARLVELFVSVLAKCRVAAALPKPIVLQP